MCSSTGDENFHSVEEFNPLEKITLREFLKASHTSHINIIADTNEIRDPTEETTFHEVKASG